MSDFKTAYRQAFKEISPQKFQTAVSSSMKSGRKKLISDSAKFLKKAFSLKRKMEVIRDRIKTLNNLKKSNAGVIDKFIVDNARFTFLAVPHKKKKRKLPPKRRGIARRLSGSPAQMVVDSVKIGGKFRKYEGVFIGKYKGQGDDLPFRRVDPNDNNSKLEVMNFNAFNAAYRNENNLEKLSENYSSKVFQEFSKKIIRAYYRNLNKTVDFVVNK